MNSPGLATAWFRSADNISCPYKEVATLLILSGTIVELFSFVLLCLCCLQFCFKTAFTFRSNCRAALATGGGIIYPFKETTLFALGLGTGIKLSPSARCFFWCQALSFLLTVTLGNKSLPFPTFPSLLQAVYIWIFGKTGEGRGRAWGQGEVRVMMLSTKSL